MYASLSAFSLTKEEYYLLRFELVCWFAKHVVVFPSKVDPIYTSFAKLCVLVASPAVFCLASYNIWKHLKDQSRGAIS